MATFYYFIFFLCTRTFLIVPQVNHIKISSDMESLAFAQRLLLQASNTVTLSIKRQAPGNSSPFHHYGLASPSSHTSVILNPFLGASKESLVAAPGSGRSNVPRKRPPNLFPGKNVSEDVSLFWDSYWGFFAQGRGRGGRILWSQQNDKEGIEA